MNMKEFKQKYEELKDNPMYQNFCSILDTKSQILERIINFYEVEIQELKKQLEEYKYSHSCSFVDTCKNVKIANYNQQKEFIEYLENEKDKLIHETSHYYIDSFDRQHAVNKTIYDEVDTILSKYRKIIGGKE